MPGLLEIMICVVVGVGAFVATKVTSVKIDMKNEQKKNKDTA